MSASANLDRERNLEDPDVLVAFVRGLDETLEWRRQVRDRKDRQYRVLDSLAHLCVSRMSGQVVAIGAAYDASEQLTLFVSENGDVQTGLKTHLEEVRARLLAIRSLVPTRLGSSRLNSFYSPNTQSPFERNAIKLEGYMLHYNRLKIHQRFVKNSRCSSFITVVKHVYSEAAAQRYSTPCDLRTQLEQLQKGIHDVDRSAQEMGAVTVLEVLDAVMTLEEHLKDKKNVRLLDVETFEFSIRVALDIVGNGIKVLKQQTTFCHSWNKYTRSMFVFYMIQHLSLTSFSDFGEGTRARQTPHEGS